MNHQSAYVRWVKPLLDRALAALLLLLTAPLMATIAAVLYVTNGGRVLFVQQRPGWRGEPFHIVKFRTMNDRRGPDGELLPDDERVTALGRFLRKTSLDELPQLLNVLSGRLSFVGPRPLLMEYLPHYNRRQARRHEVKPGITGWAQINGRNLLSWEEKFEHDVFYVDHVTFWLDVKILLLTVPRAMRQRGVDFPQSATQARFTGTPSQR